MPKVSVIMSIYNEPVEWMQQSIDSILNQTFRDFEFIIINDNPNRKENGKILDEYSTKDSRIVVLVNEVNIGLTKSLNKGLRIARGEYIARMDADDISLPGRFCKQVVFLENHPDIAVCGAWINTFGDIDSVIKYPPSMSDMCMFLESPLAHPVVMFRESVLNGVGYDESFNVSQDYALWARLYVEGAKFYNIQEPLLNYRFNKYQISSKQNSLQHTLGRKIRRELLNFELNRNGYAIIQNETFAWSDIKYLKSKLMFSNNKNRSLFIYYAYLSSSLSLIMKICYLFCSLDIFRMPLSNSIRIIYYDLLKKCMYKY